MRHFSAPFVHSLYERRNDMNDEKIISLFFERSEDALRETDSSYGEKLKRISYGITGDRRDAEECVNDAYLAVWNKIPPLRPQNLFAYLCETVRRTSLSRYRYNNREKRNGRTVSLDDELSEVIADTRDDTGDLSDILNGFLSELSEDTRYIFMRRYYYADDITAISELTGLGKNTISARLMRARKRLAEILTEKGYRI